LAVDHDYDGNERGGQESMPREGAAWAAIPAPVSSPATFFNRRAFLDERNQAMAGKKPETEKAGQKGKISEALKGVLYGMAAHGHVTAALRTRMYLEHLFMFITLGDMLGVPVIPPYYSLKILPYAVPNIKSWKQRVFRERDFTDQVF
jgi:hypothetical protein